MKQQFFYSRKGFFVFLPTNLFFTPSLNQLDPGYFAMVPTAGEKNF